MSDSSTPAATPRFSQTFVIMGVSGCGKSTLGKLLAARTGMPFYDADDFHPPENIAKMKAAIPLNDADRTPWLLALNQLLKSKIAEPGGCILACSALKQSYRDTLSHSIQPIRWIYLRGDFDVLYERLQQRKGHFMPADLLRSQLDTLEEPCHASVYDVRTPVTDIAAEIMKV